MERRTFFSFSVFARKKPPAGPAVRDRVRFVAAVICGSRITGSHAANIGSLYGAQGAPLQEIGESVFHFNDDRYKSLVLSIHILLRQQGGDGGWDIA